MEECPEPPRLQARGGPCPMPHPRGDRTTEPPESSKEIVNHSLKTGVKNEPSGEHLPRNNLALVSANAAQRIPACCCCPHSGVTSLKEGYSCDSPFSTNPVPLISFLNQIVTQGQTCPLACFIFAWQTPSSMCLLPQVWPCSTTVPPQQN